MENRLALKSRKYLGHVIPKGMLKVCEVFMQILWTFEVQLPLDLETLGRLFLVLASFCMYDLKLKGLHKIYTEKMKNFNSAFIID